MRELEEGLTALRAPEVGIGQSALLIRSEIGNLLFDVPGMISSHAVEVIRELGGIAAIVASHPHMYGVQVQYSQAFDDAPIYVAEADKQWVQRSSDAIRYWSESFEVLPGIRLHQVGGHFPGSTVAEWAAGAGAVARCWPGTRSFPWPMAMSPSCVAIPTGSRSRRRWCGAWPPNWTACALTASTIISPPASCQMPTGSCSSPPNATPGGLAETTTS